MIELDEWLPELYAKNMSHLRRMTAMIDRSSIAQRTLTSIQRLDNIGNRLTGHVVISARYGIMDIWINH